MKKLGLFPIVAVLVLVTASSAFAVTSYQVVRIPYVVNGNGWSTGLAITNLSSATITGLTLDLCDKDGHFYDLPVIIAIAAPEEDPSSEIMAPPNYNFRKSLGSLKGFAMKVGFLEALYGEPLPGNPLWVEIWHAGTEQFAVTLAIMNLSTGQGEGFGFHSFFSESRGHTFPEMSE